MGRIAHDVESGYWNRETHTPVELEAGPVRWATPGLHSALHRYDVPHAHARPRSGLQLPPDDAGHRWTSVVTECPGTGCPHTHAHEHLLDEYGVMSVRLTEEEAREALPSAGRELDEVLDVALSLVATRLREAMEYVAARTAWSEWAQAWLPIPEPVQASVSRSIGQELVRLVRDGLASYGQVAEARVACLALAPPELHASLEQAAEHRADGIEALRDAAPGPVPDTPAMLLAWQSLTHDLQNGTLL